MMRILLTVVVPLVAPLIAYVIWVWFTQQQEEVLAQGRKLPPWQSFPWTWLIISGAVLAIISVITFSAVGDNDAESEYRPARYEDGKLIPGEFTKKPKPAP